MFLPVRWCLANLVFRLSRKLNKQIAFLVMSRFTFEVFPKCYKEVLNGDVQMDMAEFERATCAYCVFFIFVKWNLLQILLE